jgi:hypothetical protein
MTLPKYVTKNSLKKPSTSSSVGIYATLIQTLKEYQNPNGEMLRDFIGQPERIWVASSGVNPVFPYITIRLDRTSNAEYNGYRETAVLEVQAVGRPEAQLPMVESIMDIVDQCMTALTFSASGLVVGRSRLRQTLPQMNEPADSAVCGVVGSYTLFLWPDVLTSRRP